ncbi:hypothetical protein [Nonomuraea sp. NPDC049695]|uniref:hypothetical protein n=1 Tax=Nonomuraea sp. NPDC049695 TaxID=3154734 RepID=UPI003423010A
MRLPDRAISSDVHVIQRADGRVIVARHYSGSPVGDPDGLDGEHLHADVAALRDASIEKVTVGDRDARRGTRGRAGPVPGRRTRAAPL